MRSLTLPKASQSVFFNFVCNLNIGSLLNLSYFCFPKVYVEPLSKSDLLFITEALYPQIDPGILDKMVTFNTKVLLYPNILVLKLLPFSIDN